MAGHKYKLVYKTERHPEGLTKEQLQARPDGKEISACDASLIASIIYPEDGSLSILFIGEDGRTNTELADHEWFKVWILLAKRLGDSQTLDPGKKEIAAFTFESWCKLMQGDYGPPTS